MTDLTLMPARPGDPIQSSPAWWRGYEARMWGVAQNMEVGFCARFAYDQGVLDAEIDERLDEQDR